MFIHGTIRCEKCGKEFEWDHLPAQRLSGGQVFATGRSVYPKRQSLSNVYPIAENKYLLTVRCPCCDMLNRFEYETSLHL